MTTLVLARHYLRDSFRSGFGIAVTAAQPVLFLILFGPVFAGSGVGSWEVLVPGLLIQLCLLSSGMAGFGIVVDRRFGVLERLRVTPVSRISLLLGRVLRDAVILLVQATGLIVLGYAFGLRAAPAAVLAGLLLVLLLAVGLAALSYALALTMREELFMPLVGTGVVPLLLLSGALLPMSFAPGWLDAASRATPLRWVVEALRALFAGSYTSAPVIIGTAVAVALAAAGLAVGTRAVNRRSG